MKLNENYILKTVAGTAVVVPVGDAAADIHGMIKLNDAALFIWKLLQDGADRDGILFALTKEYAGVPQATLAADLDAFLNTLTEKNILL